MSDYPDAIDTLDTVAAGDFIIADHENNQTSAILAIENALGTDPFGPYDTVKDAIAGKLDLSGGTMSGALDMGGGSANHQIHHVADPSSAQDVATQNFVDGKFPSTTAGTYPKVTVNTLGLVTDGSSLAAGDIPSTLNATAFSGQVTSNGMLDVAAGMETATASKTAAYTLAVTDNTIFGDASGGAWNLTTPATVNVGQRFRLYKTDSSSNAISVVANSGQTVSGIASIGTQWQGLELVAESSTQWVCNLLPVYNAAPYTAGTGLALSGNQFSLSTPVSIANGGTNATSASGALSNLGAAASGANADITAMTGLTGALQAPTQVNDSNGNKVLGFADVASAVNALQVKNAATGAAAELDAVGSDTNVSINLVPKGTGNVQFGGAPAATQGYVDGKFPSTTAGTYPKVTVNASGLVTAGSALAAGDIPSTLNATTFSGQVTADAMLDVAAGMETVTATQTAAYTLAVTDNTIFGDASGGAWNLTTPATVNVGQRFRVYKTDSSANAITVVANSGQTVSGFTAATLQWQGVEIVAESSTQWVCNLLPITNGMTYTAGTGLSLSGTQFSLNTPVSIANGGTNATSASGALSNLGAAASGGNADLTSLTGLTGALQAPTQVNDSNGNKVLGFANVASAVNALQVKNAATGAAAELDAVGSDTNVSINLVPKGTGNVQLGGAPAATQGYVDGKFPSTTAGTYPKVTVNASGLVTAGSALAAADIPSTLNATTFSGQITSSGMLDVGAGMETATASKTVAYTLAVTDNTIFGDASSGAWSLTTPSTVNVGQRFRLYKVDSSSNVISVVANSGQTVSGITSIGTQWQGLELVAETSTQWICNLLPVYSAAAYSAGHGLSLSGTQFALSTPVSAADLPSLDQITVPAANVSMNSHKITSVTDPTSAQDAATKNYVDGKFPSTTAGTYPKVTVNAAGLVTAGSTLAVGDIPTLDHTKISDFDSQVNAHKVTDLTAPTSDFSMNSHKITNVTDPSNAQDAATKNYVDNSVLGTFTAGMMMPFAGVTVPNGWLACDGSSQARTTYSALWSALSSSKGTVTLTIAAPCVVTLNSHGFTTGDAIYLTTTGALPTSLSTNTTYYVSVVSTNTFNLCTTYQNAQAGTPRISTAGGSQSGTHSLIYAPFGIPAASTTNFNLPDLRGRVPLGAGTGTASGASAWGLGNTPLGTGTASEAGGEETHTLTVAELASHTHSAGTYAVGSHNHAVGTYETPYTYICSGGSNANMTQGGGNFQFSQSIQGSSANTTPTFSGSSGSAGSGSAHNIMQPITGVNFIIKT